MLQFQDGGCVPWGVIVGAESYSREDPAPFTVIGTGRLKIPLFGPLGCIYM